MPGKTVSCAGVCWWSADDAHLLRLLVVGLIAFVLFAFTIVGLVGEALIVLSLVGLLARAVSTGTHHRAPGLNAEPRSFRLPP